MSRTNIYHEHEFWMNYELMSRRIKDVRKHELITSWLGKARKINKNQSSP
jgi:hypothetical protein